MSSDARPIPVFKGTPLRRITTPPPPPKAQDAGLWTTKETSSYLRISPRVLFEETKQKHIRHIRIGRLVRYDPADVRAYLEARKQGGTIPIKESGA